MPQMESVTIIMPAEMVDRLQALAIRAEMARDWIIQQAITEYIQRMGKGV